MPRHQLAAVDQYALAVSGLHHLAGRNQIRDHERTLCCPLHATVTNCGFWVAIPHESEIAVFIHFWVGYDAATRMSALAGQITIDAGGLP